MSYIKDIKRYNLQSFLDDLKRVSECGIYPSATNGYFKVSKRTVKVEAQSHKINYMISTDVYRVGREVMIIL